LSTSPTLIAGVLVVPSYLNKDFIENGVEMSPLALAYFSYSSFYYYFCLSIIIACYFFLYSSRAFYNCSSAASLSSIRLFAFSP